MWSQAGLQASLDERDLGAPEITECLIMEVISLKFGVKDTGREAILRFDYFFLPHTTSTSE
jgi:hypothetical protein